MSATISYRPFVGYAAGAPEMVGILSQLEGGKTLFEQALLPYSRETIERGVASGRFSIVDVDLGPDDDRGTRC